MSVFDIKKEEMPKVLALLPFHGQFLFPGASASLRVFEPRYLSAVFDSLSSSRIIGIIHPAVRITDDKHPKLYAVGCAGRITGFTETKDDKLSLDVLGITRFTTIKELPQPRGYRMAEVCCAAFPDFDPVPKNAIDRRKILSAFDKYAYMHELDLTSKMLAGSDDLGVLNTLSMVLPFSPNEKQLLLEAKTLADRSRILLSLLEMGGTSSSSYGGGHA